MGARTWPNGEYRFPQLNAGEDYVIRPPEPPEGHEYDPDSHTFTMPGDGSGTDGLNFVLVLK
jgi:hypothetical protein